MIFCWRKPSKMSIQEQLQPPLIEALKQRMNIENSLQLKAWEAFLKLGLPGPKEEAFKYFKLGGLYQKSWEMQPFDPDEIWLSQELKALSAKNYIVTYNGVFLENFSSYPDFKGKLFVLPFSQAIKSYEAFFNSHYTSQLSLEKDPFALLTLATLKSGLFIYVPKNSQFSEELTLIELSSGEEAQSFSSATFVSLGQQASLKLSTLARSSGNTEMLALVYKGIHLDQGAKLEHTHSCIKAESYRLEASRIEQMRDSRYKQTLGVVSTPKMRQSLQVHLNQEGAETDLSGVLALAEKEQGHIHALVCHNAPYCESSQLYKHLLSDDSLSSFEGKIWVDKEAQKTNAYQLNQNCLLSSNAQAYSKPNLEIFADDVKASHGSTTGQLDNEQLFYLLSRGLSKAEAQQILLKGFCDEVLEKSHNLNMRALLQKAIKDYLRDSL